MYVYARVGMADKKKESFLKACSKGQLKSVQRQLAKGFNPSESLTHNEKWNLLEGICRNNHVNILTCLYPVALDLKAVLECNNVHTYFEAKTSAFCIAVQFTDESDHSILEYMLDCDCELDSTIYYSDRLQTVTYSALTFAVSLGMLKTAKYLVSKGARVDNSVETLKHACFMYNMWMDLLQLAVENGANLNEEDCTPLHWILPDQTNLLDSTLSFVNDRSLQLNAKGIDAGDSFSCPDKQLEAFEYLLKSGSDPNKKEPDLGMSPGHMVGRGHRVELYKLLLAHGWDLHSTDTRGWTALHYSIIGNDIEAVKFLVAEGAQLGNPNNYEFILPFHVMETHVLSIYEIVSSIGQDQIDSYNSLRIEVFEFLLSVGLDLNSHTHSNSTLAEMLCGVGYFEEFLEWLVKQKIKLAFGGDVSKLDAMLGNHFMGCTKTFKHTFCYLAAGFSDTAFAKKHEELAILANERGDYQIAKHANPFAVYQLDFVNLKNVICDTSVTSKTKKGRKTNLPRSHTWNQGLADQQTAPSLVQLVVYNTRRHLVLSRNNTTLFPIIQELEIPDILKKLLTLEAFA